MADTYPAWMHEALEDMESGRDTAPVFKFDTHADAARDRLRFYKFLNARKAEGCEIAHRVLVKWESDDGTKSKRVLRFVMEETSVPTRVQGADKETLDEQALKEKMFADLRKKYST